MTDLSASALDNDPQGLDLLRSVLGQPKRLPLGQAGFQAAEAAAEARVSARRRGRARRELRPSL